MRHPVLQKVILVVGVVALLLLLIALGGCAATGSGSDTIRVASLRGPTTMGLVKLIHDAGEDSATNPWRISVHGTPDEIVTLLAKGETDVALIPANLAAVLHNRTDGGVQVAAINTLGVLSVVETGHTIVSLADLAGRTVYSTGKGATPEFVLNFLLSRNGLEPGRDLTVEYRSEATEVAAVLATLDDGIALLPQPFATVALAGDPRLRVALDLTTEWDAVNPGSAQVTGVLVIRKEYAASHPEVVDAFLAAYRRSVEFTNQHPDQAAPLIVEAGIVPNAELAERAIPACNITYIDGPEARRLLTGYLQVLHDADPASVGGSVPGDGFYYQP